MIRNRKKEASLGFRFAVGWMLAAVCLPATADIVEGTSEAYGAFVDLAAIGGTINADIGPLAPSAGSAPVPYLDTGSALNVDVTAGGVPLVGSLIDLQAGAFDTEASSNVDGLAGNRATTATATINGLNATVGEFLPLLGSAPLVAITADTIEVISSLSGDFGAMATLGSMFVEDLQINVLGSVVDLSAVIDDGFVAANTQIALDAFGLAGASLTLNQQIASGDGINTFGIETNAIALNLNAVNVGGFTGLNGDVVIGHTAASVAAVPEPSSLLLTTGLVGVVLAGRGWRRWKRPAAA